MDETKTDTKTGSLGPGSPAPALADEVPGAAPGGAAPPPAGPVRVAVTRDVGAGLAASEECLDLRGTEAFVVVRGTGDPGRPACTLGYVGPASATPADASRGRAMAWLAVTEALGRDSEAPASLRRLCAAVLAEVERAAAAGGAAADSAGKRP